MAKVPDDQARQFVFSKFEELATYMESQGFDRGWLGSCFLGVGYTWVTLHQGPDAAKECVAFAQLAVEKKQSTLQ